MTKTFLALFTSLMIFSAASGQSTKTVYFELGGPGVASFNFDTRVSGRNDGLGFRAGFGGFSDGDESIFFFPLQVNYLFGKDTKHFFEVGAGATIVTQTGDFDSDGIFESSFGHAYFGYRRQPADGGFLFRAGITPIFNITSRNSFFLPFYAGVSFGYAF
ncbi:MAG: hypothetical protein H7Y03_09525 [Chitinophagaceae bacterium]|nr:hypothetical protein [Chitinophagaceae bacterium]